jgi:hypothetical protein
LGTVQAGVVGGEVLAALGNGCRVLVAEVVEQEPVGVALLAEGLVALVKQTVQNSPGSAGVGAVDEVPGKAISADPVFEQKTQGVVVGR